jgi:hypothetical protein
MTKRILHTLMMILISLGAFFGARYISYSAVSSYLYGERQGMVTADAPAHASAGIDTLTHEDLHAAPLRKGDKLQ